MSTADFIPVDDSNTESNTESKVESKVESNTNTELETKDSMHNLKLESIDPIEYRESRLEH